MKLTICTLKVFFGQRVKKKTGAIQHFDKASDFHTSAMRELSDIQGKLSNAHLGYDKAIIAERKVVEDRTVVDHLRPGFFTRLFKTTKYRDWYEKMEQVINVVNTSRDQLQNIKSEVECIEKEYSIAKSKVKQSETDRNKADQLLKYIKSKIDEGQKLLGINLADELFWEQDDKKMQLTSPWIYKGFQQARDEMIVASFALHRAFIDGAAKHIKNNLRAMLEIMKGRNLNEKQEEARRSLWATLFIVVPVVSTTFTSM